MWYKCTDNWRSLHSHTAGALCSTPPLLPGWYHKAPSFFFVAKLILLLYCCTFILIQSALTNLSTTCTPSSHWHTCYRCSYVCYAPRQNGRWSDKNEQRQTERVWNTAGNDRRSTYQREALLHHPLMSTNVIDDALIYCYHPFLFRHHTFSIIVLLEGYLFISPYHHHHCSNQFRHTETNTVYPQPVIQLSNQRLSGYLLLLLDMWKPLLIVPFLCWSPIKCFLWSHQLVVLLNCLVVCLSCVLSLVPCTF